MFDEAAFEGLWVVVHHVAGQHSEPLKHTDKDSNVREEHEKLMTEVGRKGYFEVVDDQAVAGIIRDKILNIEVCTNERWKAAKAAAEAQHNGLTELRKRGFVVGPGGVLVPPSR